jgi:glycosyltransferase involved in cell wall biosynthesis
MKKVLIITYYWPPAGGPGVQRVLKFAKYLPEYGWQPVILTVLEGEYPSADYSLLKDISPSCTIFKTKSLEPFSIYKKFIKKSPDSNISTDILTQKEGISTREKFSQWLRANLFIPDAKIGWIPYARKAGIRIIKNENINLIFSSSPPHSVQLVARYLAQRSGLKWVADFRDPWMEIVYYQNLKRNFFTRYIDKRLEKRVLEKSNSVISISNSILELFKHKVRLKEGHVIPNGFDQEDFRNIEYKRSKQFTITYTGVLSDERIPYCLLPALKRFQKENLNFRLQLYGHTCIRFRNIIASENLQDHVNFFPYVSHDHVVKTLIYSDVLLLIIDNVPNNKGFLTGKLFDYLGSKRPILAIGPINGDAAGIISKTNSGTIISYEDNENAYTILKKRYKDWENNSTTFDSDTGSFERKHLTQKLANVFNTLMIEQ